VDVDLPDVPGPYSVLVRGLDLNGVTRKEKLLRDKWARVMGMLCHVPPRIENINVEHLGYDPGSSEMQYSHPHLSFNLVDHPRGAPHTCQIRIYPIQGASLDHPIKTYDVPNPSIGQNVVRWIEDLGLGEAEKGLYDFDIIVKNRYDVEAYRLSRFMAIASVSAAYFGGDPQSAYTTIGGARQRKVLMQHEITDTQGRAASSLELLAVDYNDFSERPLTQVTGGDLKPAGLHSYNAALDISKLGGCYFVVRAHDAKGKRVLENAGFQWPPASNFQNMEWIFWPYTADEASEKQQQLIDGSRYASRMVEDGLARDAYWALGTEAIVYIDGHGNSNVISPRENLPGLHELDVSATGEDPVNDVYPVNSNTQHKFYQCRLAFFKGCYTGRGDGNTSIPKEAVKLGADCAVGFTEELVVFTIGATYAAAFWEACRWGKTVHEAHTWALYDVWEHYLGYWGYDSYVVEPSGGDNITLVPARFGQ
jgi:hypothetical protein